MPIRQNPRFAYKLINNLGIHFNVTGYAKIGNVWYNHLIKFLPSPTMEIKKPVIAVN